NMARLIALYDHPTDTAAFEQHLTGTHLPLARKIPGLQSLETSRGPVMTAEGPGPYHLVVMLGFETMDDLHAGLNSPEGHASAADAAILGTSGVTVLVFDSHEA
ncbi:MAG TPA: EthD family reductase, partial [Longimicrobium sp.]|nr:EthD family reductase [Longimicrobium sp.]